jgi:hypothetical protein
VFVSDTFVKMTGYTNEETIGRNCASLVPIPPLFLLFSLTSFPLLGLTFVHSQVVSSRLPAEERSKDNLASTLTGMRRFVLPLLSPLLPSEILTKKRNIAVAHASAHPVGQGESVELDQLHEGGKAVYQPRHDVRFFPCRPPLLPYLPLRFPFRRPTASPSAGIRKKSRTSSASKSTSSTNPTPSLTACPAVNTSSTTPSPASDT